MMNLLAGGAASEPAIDILFEQPAWRTVPDVEDIIRRAIGVAARFVPGFSAPSPQREGEQGSALIRSEDGLLRPALPEGTELSVLLCDDDAIAGLNARWRGREGPTNVLSFPAPQPPSAYMPHGAPIPLGDVAIAYETVAREAAELGKPVRDHLAHLAVHGFLHLLGYDHQGDREAERMEQLESDILARIGIADPYIRTTDDGRQSAVFRASEQRS
jgi:probable rRNA maturation factor